MASRNELDQEALDAQLVRLSESGDDIGVERRIKQGPSLKALYAARSAARKHEKYRIAAIIGLEIDKRSKQ